ncbi:MAG: hypothetical protein LH474_08190 [Chamaesiphon sp.]|nr:hypothetical protein [Chamaesiphon sp.]
MSVHPKESNNLPTENIDEVLDAAIENAEARKELSESELDEVAGGVILGGISRDW